MNGTGKPILMRLPVKGEWNTPNTPGTRIPSHGTNALGTRYAFDFLQLNWHRSGHPCYQAHILHYLLFGIAVDTCFCYGKHIYAPCDGTVVYVADDSRERTRAWLLTDFLRARKNSRLKRDQNTKEITGNAIIIKHQDSIYAAFCHLQPGSVQVSVGQRIRKGDFIGRIGHTGNSMFPHLHFQLMDSANIQHANGLPCAFEQYEVFESGRWRTVYNGIPTANQRIRSTGE